ncbi:peptidoglycan-binding protein [Nocardia sp. NPDC052254]|uniref:peptidoglycan-binding protein n=1 Tax=Nocardia sp. NPDC052254 TaxID=3155681 RepID=UPI003439BEB5
MKKLLLALCVAVVAVMFSIGTAAARPADGDGPPPQMPKPAEPEKPHKGKPEAPAPEANNQLQPYPGSDFFHNGQNSAIVTNMGKRLVEVGCSRYQVGPSPQWSDADRNSYKCWQEKLGYSGGDADGIPGPASWNALHVPHV